MQKQQEPLCHLQNGSTKAKYPEIFGVFELNFLQPD